MSVLAPLVVALAAHPLVFERLLGVSALRGGVGDAVAGGLLATWVLIVAEALAWPLAHIGADGTAPWLHLPGLVAASAVAIAVVDALASRLAVIVPVWQRLRFAIAGNTLLLGSLAIVARPALGFGASLLAAAAAGLGFTLASVLFVTLRARCATAEVPAALRGAPLDLLLIALMALGFAGLGGLEHAL